MTRLRDQELELHKNHREVQIKHTYYLLAIAAALIAFSVQKTEGLSFSCSQIPLGIAVFLWSLSFVSGCLFSNNYLDTYRLNAELLRILEEDPEYDYEPTEIDQQDILEREMNHYASKAQRYGNIQFISLIIGGVFFLLWHFIEMLVNT